MLSRRGGYRNEEDTGYDAGGFHGAGACCVRRQRGTGFTEFSVCGGGHTAAVIEQIGLASDFSHLSTGGGACIEFLTGKKLPALDALEKSWELFGGRI